MFVRESSFSRIYHPELEERVPEVTPDSKVEDLFFDARCQLRYLIDCDPDFIAFRGLPDPLFTFIYGEKQCLSMTPNTREIYDDHGNIIDGYESHYRSADNAYHPKVMRPFDLEGYWIPVTEGKIFVFQAPEGPLTRVRGGVLELLFLVHPSSKDLYKPLCQKYADSCIRVPALALSSFRTLLIAVPKEYGGVAYEMVKLSLDAEIGGVERRLHQKECACSVATTALLSQRPKTIDCLFDDWSFVPRQELINPDHKVAVERGAGMIHRQIPSWLTDPFSQEYVVPLYALFGRKNWPLLRALIKKSELTPTQFIKIHLLQPFAELLVDHAVFQRTSLELHGQNLLLRITCPREGEVKIGFAYRDMRGANTQPTEDELAALPNGLGNRDYFYSESYSSDAAWVIERISGRVCFEFTKQLFKAEEIQDPEFTEWKRKMIQLGYAGNWTVPGEEGDLHVMKHTEQSFFRYCYFSKIFARCLLEVLIREGVFLDLVDEDPKLNYIYFDQLLGSPLDPCLKVHWFKHLVMSVLSL
jgi:hypothetical protein